MKELTRSELRWIDSIRENVVRYGYVDPTGKSKGDIEKEVDAYLDESFGMKDTRVVGIIDHTSTLLNHARSFRKAGKYEVACLFYAVWLEHWFNHVILLAGTRKRLTESEVTRIIQETQFRGKSTWLFKILDLRPINATHLKRIQRVIESRNAYVHYKWKSVDVDDDQDLNEWKTLGVLIHEMEKTVKYLHDWENRQFFHGKKSAFRRA